MKMEKHMKKHLLNNSVSRVFIALTVMLVFFAGGCDRLEQDTQRPLRLYAGAGMRNAVEKLRAAFEQKTGIAVEADYAGSGMLITRAREDRDADLFMPGDVWYVNRLHELTGLIETRASVCFFVPVIIVQKGNPKKIQGLNDFTRDDVSVAIGRPDACQVGRITGKILANAGIDRTSLECKESITVNELGVWVKMRDVDAAVVWDAIAANVAESVDIIKIPKEQNIISRVVIGLLKTSSNKAAAEQFMAFMTSPEARRILQDNKYRTDEP
jgi:molybdate transport system substrate-binding protein